MKRGQEELVGFGLIIVIVSVIMLFFLWFYLTKPSESNLQDYEAENLVRATLDYTTLCQERSRDFISIGELISWCYFGDKTCESGNSCGILNDTLDEIFDAAMSASGGKIFGIFG